MAPSTESLRRACHSLRPKSIRTWWRNSKNCASRIRARATFQPHSATSWRLFSTMRTVLDDAQRKTIRQLCAIVELRPFPARPWARLALLNLNRPRVLAEKLELFLEDKRNVEAKIGSVAAANAPRLGFVQHANVLVVGFSYMFPLIFPAVPDVSTMTIWAPTHAKRGISEGQELKQQLEQRHEGIRVEVRETGDLIAMLRRGAFTTVVVGARRSGCWTTTSRSSNRRPTTNCSRRPERLLRRGSSSPPAATNLATGLVRRSGVRRRQEPGL